MKALRRYFRTANAGKGATPRHDPVVSITGIIEAPSSLLPALHEHRELPGHRGDLDRRRLVGDAFGVEERSRRDGTEVELSASVSLFRGSTVSSHRFGVVLGYVLALVVQDPENELSLSVPRSA